MALRQRRKKKIKKGSSGTMPPGYDAVIPAGQGKYPGGGEGIGSDFSARTPVLLSQIGVFWVWRQVALDTDVLCSKAGLLPSRTWMNRFKSALRCALQLPGGCGAPSRPWQPALEGDACWLRSWQHNKKTRASPFVTLGVPREGVLSLLSKPVHCAPHV
jgi:hypothetical protein